MVAVVATPDRAAAESELYVLTAGGTDHLEVMTVDDPTGDEPAIADSGTLDLQLQDRDLATYTDLVVWPGGSLLLADGSGSGAIVFDSDGHQTDQLFDHDTYPAPAGLVVASFVDPDLPSSLLVADAGGEVLLFDPVDEAFTFSFSPDGADPPPEPARAVALPDDRAAVAVRRPATDSSTIEIVDLDEADATTVATSRADADAPHIEGLDPVRSLMADTDDRLLVTSRDQVAIVDDDGELDWRYAVGQAGQLGGQLEAALWLESGLVVAATRQPGLFNQPHTNHRLHLLDPEADDSYLTSSPPLQAAPLQLDTIDGHGGTGTLGYDAGASEPTTPADELTVTGVPTVEPDSVALDATAELSLELTNDTDHPVSLRRLELSAVSAPCDADDRHEAPATDWWADPDPDDIAPDSSLQIDGTSLVAEQLGVGLWCGQFFVVDADGHRHGVDGDIDIEILPPEQGPGSPVESDDLTGFDDAGLPTDFRPDDQTEGCGCRSSASPLPGSVAVVVAMLVLLSALRRLVQAPASRG